MKFLGKVVLITGGGGGIGEVAAMLFAAEGAKVVVADNRFDSARRVADEITSSKQIAYAQELDVRSAEIVEAVVRKYEDTLGNIDVLANCAGVPSVHPFDQITDQIWNEAIDINAKGTFFCCKSVAKQMIRHRIAGKIVNISSVAGQIGMPLYLAYCASKFAVIGITQSLALELGKYKINVNAICPGDVETGMLLDSMTKNAKRRGVSVDTIREELRKMYPLGRLGQPIDIAHLILFLASDEASWITGQAITASGGLTSPPVVL